MTDTKGSDTQSDNATIDSEATPKSAQKTGSSASKTSKTTSSAKASTSKKAAPAKKNPAKTTSKKATATESAETKATTESKATSARAKTAVKTTSKTGTKSASKAPAQKTDKKTDDVAEEKKSATQKTPVKKTASTAQKTSARVAKPKADQSSASLKKTADTTGKDESEKLDGAVSEASAASAPDKAKTTAKKATASKTIPKATKAASKASTQKSAQETGEAVGEKVSPAPKATAKKTTATKKSTAKSTPASKTETKTEAKKRASTATSPVPETALSVQEADREVGVLEGSKALPLEGSKAKGLPAGKETAVLASEERKILESGEKPALSASATKALSGSSAKELAGTSKALPAGEDGEKKSSSPKSSSAKSTRKTAPKRTTQGTKTTKSASSKGTAKKTTTGPEEGDIAPATGPKGTGGDVSTAQDAETKVASPAHSATAGDVVAGVEGAEKLAQDSADASTRQGAEQVMEQGVEQEAVKEDSADSLGEEALEGAEKGAEDQGASRGAGNRGRKPTRKGSSKGTSSKTPSPTADEESLQGENGRDEKAEKESSAGKGGKSAPKAEPKKAQPAARAQRRKMFVSVMPEEQIEVVITEEGQVQEYYVEMLQQQKTKGNIYKAIIHNVDANLQAAFVNYGANKNGFLQIDEVHPEYYNVPHDEKSGRRFPPIQKVLKPGQELLVQVVKEPNASKGAFLTTYLSLAGRFLVLTPGREQIGVSRKVDDGGERERLREMLEDFKPGPGLGVIVRTVSMGMNKATLKKDLQSLKTTWKKVRALGTEEVAPKLIHEEIGLATRSVRDYLTDQIVEVWLDDAETAKDVEELVTTLFPKKSKLVHVHSDFSISLFERFNLQRQLDQIQSREVPLPSGGRLVIDTTEALTAIDINSGRSGGKSNFEDTAFRTNMEAAKMIPLQLRLRDIGGQVVCDFIEMRDKSHWREVEKTVRSSMKIDRARHDVGRISSFGLLELVRQRLGSSAISVNMEVCPHCKGSGVRRNMEWQSQQALKDIARKMRAAKEQRQTSISYGVDVTLAMHLLNSKRQRLSHLEEQLGVTVEIILAEQE